MNYPKISIVTPSYNQAQYLEDTIKSVLDQQYPNLEYIIIDGGSTDGSVDIIKKYEKYLAYWVSKSYQGLYPMVEDGFKKSSGEIMAWLNSDDMYHRKSLFTVAEIFTDFPKIKWMMGNPTWFDDQGRIVQCAEAPRWSKYRFYTGDYRWIQQESTFWRKELWEKAGAKMDPSLKLAGDLELWIRFFRHEQLYVIKGLIGGFRVRAKNQKSLESLNEYFIEAEKLLKREPISFQDRTRIPFIKLYKLLLFHKIPILGAIPYSYLMKFPPEFVFDRFTQKFVYKKFGWN